MAEPFEGSARAEAVDRQVAPRKRRRVCCEPGHLHFITYSCFDRLPLLARDRVRRWVVEAIEIARQRHQIRVYAYVIMPEHVHLLVHPEPNEYSLDGFLYDLKRPVSWKAKKFLLESGNARWLARLTVKRGKNNCFRFWLPGGGFDHNIFRIKGLQAVVDYIHANPVRRELVQRPTDWKWSSAGFWAGKTEVPLNMDAFCV